MSLSNLHATRFELFLYLEKIPFQCETKVGRTNTNGKFVFNYFLDKEILIREKSYDRYKEFKYTYTRIMKQVVSS